MGRRILLVPGARSRDGRVAPFSNPRELSSSVGVLSGTLCAGNDVFLDIDPTARFRYEMRIPGDHAQGLMRAQLCAMLLPEAFRGTRRYV